jgi:hypothetical protein
MAIQHKPIASRRYPLAGRADKGRLENAKSSHGPFARKAGNNMRYEQKPRDLINTSQIKQGQNQHLSRWPGSAYGSLSNIALQYATRERSACGMTDFFS